MSDIVFRPIKGAPPSIEWLPVTCLQIDEKYQRSIESPASKRLILSIACNWDWRLFNTITVSRRNDADLFVIDGQHRLEAAKMRGDILHLPATVSRFDDLADEAKFFVNVNTSRKNPTALDKFNARCTAGDAEALEIKGLVEDAGLKIGRNNYQIKESEVCCIAVITRLFRQYGAKILSGALTDMAEAYPGQGLRVANEMLPGICLLLYSPPKDFDIDLFIEVLKSRDQIHWFASGRSSMDSDPDAEYPDEVFRDILLTPYLKLVEQNTGLGRSKGGRHNSGHMDNGLSSSLDTNHQLSD